MKLLPFLVQPKLNLSNISPKYNNLNFYKKIIIKLSLEVISSFLQLTHESLELRLTETVPVEQHVRQRVALVILDLELDLLQLVLKPPLLLHQLDVELLLTLVLLLGVRVVCLVVPRLHRDHVPLHHPDCLLQLRVCPF